MGFSFPGIFQNSFSGFLEQVGVNDTKVLSTVLFPLL